MPQSILDGKKILAIDDEPDVLAVLEEEITYKCPNAKFEKATTYEDAKKLLESQNYDVVVLDIMGVRGFDLLDIAVKRNLKVAMLTAHALTPEALKRSYDMRARAYLPKEQAGGGCSLSGGRAEHTTTSQAGSAYLKSSMAFSARPLNRTGKRKQG